MKLLDQTSTRQGNVIKELVGRHGEEVLSDPRLFSLVAENLRDDRQMLKRMRLAISVEGIPEKMLVLKPLGDQERGLKINALAAELAYDYGMEARAAASLVNYFCEAVGYKATAAVNAAKPEIGSIIPFVGYDWRVLEVKNGSALLISEKVVEKRAYHSHDYGTTWAKCELRAYLNEEFYDMLNSQDKARIAHVRLKNNDNPWFTAEGGQATADHVFLLSIEEAVKYFGDSRRLASEYKEDVENGWIADKYNEARLAKDSHGEAAWWWLRSPGDSNNSAANVDADGTLFVVGRNVDYSSGGIRPALYLKL